MPVRSGVEQQEQPLAELTCYLTGTCIHLLDAVMMHGQESW